MRSYAVIVAALAVTAAGCGATTRSTTIQAPASPVLTSATATFVSREHGKDADSALTVQLLRANAELAGEIRSTGVEFDDNNTSGPFAFAMMGSFRAADIDDGQLRIRFVPDGSDDWVFDLTLVARFSDGSSRTFAWRGIRLDNATQERTLALAPARI